MSDLTWVMILGSIAILFPLIVIATYNELDITPSFNNTEFYNEDDYNEIKNYTCNNYNYETLIENKHLFNTGLTPFPSKSELKLYCFVSNTWLEDFISNRLIAIDDIMNEDLTNNRGVSKIINVIGLNKFFDAIDSLPRGIATFIYSIYLLLITWLVYKAVTLA